MTLFEYWEPLHDCPSKPRCKKKGKEKYINECFASTIRGWLCRAVLEDPCPFEIIPPKMTLKSSPNMLNISVIVDLNLDCQMVVGTSSRDCPAASTCGGAYTILLSVIDKGNSILIRHSDEILLRKNVSSFSWNGIAILPRSCMTTIHPRSYCLCGTMHAFWITNELACRLSKSTLWT